MKLNEKIGIGLVTVGVIAIAVIVGFGTRTNFSGAMVTSACTVSTVSNSAVGDDLTTTLLPAYSNRGWARIQVADGEVEPIFLSFDEGADATVDNGLALTATSTTYIDFGLNTDFPYTGAVTGITGSASTTVLITECRF